MHRLKLLAGLGAALALQPAPLLAQAWQCQPPKFLPRPALDMPALGQVRRSTVNGYLLVLSWSPEHCRGQERAPNKRFQCSGEIGDFGFVLHGLWPQSKGAAYPQYCRSVGILPRRIIAENICLSPAPQLLQHQWAKHGTCMTKTPDAYFAAARVIFNAIEFPDMARLSREPERGTVLTAAILAERFSDNNEGLPASAVAVKTTAKGWLEEVRICLGRDLKPLPCPSHSRLTSGKTPIKIWRGR